MNLAFLTKKMNKLNRVPAPKKREKYGPHKKDGVANIYLAEEAAELLKAQEHPSGECVSLITGEVTRP